MRTVRRVARAEGVQGRQVGGESEREQRPDLELYWEGVRSLWEAVCRGMLRSPCMRNGWREAGVAVENWMGRHSVEWTMVGPSHEVYLGSPTQTSSLSQQATSSRRPSWTHTLCHFAPVPTLSPKPPSRVHAIFRTGHAASSTRP